MFFEINGRFCLFKQRLQEESVGIVQIGAPAGATDKREGDEGVSAIDLVNFNGAANAVGSIGKLLIEVDEVAFYAIDGIVKIGVHEGIVVEEIDKIIEAVGGGFAGNEVEGKIALTVTGTGVVLEIIYFGLFREIGQGGGAVGVDNDNPAEHTPGDIDAFGDFVEVFGARTRGNNIDKGVIAQVSAGFISLFEAAIMKNVNTPHKKDREFFGVQGQPDGSIDSLDGFVFGTFKHIGAYALPDIFTDNHKVPGDVAGERFYLEAEVSCMRFGYSLMEEYIGRFIVSIAGNDVFVMAPACVTGKHSGAGIFIDVFLDMVAEIGAQESDVAIHYGEPVVGIREALKFAVVGEG